MGGGGRMSETGKTIALIKALSGGGGLPPVTASDAGKVATVDNSGVWGAQEPIGKKFIVTMTPTSPDFSGTMDKTVSEIYAAYEAGQQVVFRVYSSETRYNDVNISILFTDTAYQYPSCNGYIIDNVNNLLIFAYTGQTNDGTKATYYTAIYTLTPAT